MEGIRDDYLYAKTVHASHVFHRITVDFVLAARIMTETTGEESMAVRTKHFCASKIVFAAKNSVFFVLQSHIHNKGTCQVISDSLMDPFSSSSCVRYCFVVTSETVSIDDRYSKQRIYYTLTNCYGPVT